MFLWRRALGRTVGGFISAVVALGLSWYDLRYSFSSGMIVNYWLLLFEGSRTRVRSRSSTLAVELGHRGDTQAKKVVAQVHVPHIIFGIWGGGVICACDILGREGFHGHSRRNQCTRADDMHLSWIDAFMSSIV